MNDNVELIKVVNGLYVFTIRCVPVNDVRRPNSFDLYSEIFFYINELIKSNRDNGCAGFKISQSIWKLIKDLTQTMI